MRLRDNAGVRAVTLKRRMPSFLPISTQQVRPRLVCEVRPGGVVAARADSATGLLSEVAHTALPEGAVVPSVRNANLANRAAVIFALQNTLARVKGSARDVTVVVPDASVRVTLLDFDSLPAKIADAMPVVRFRLAKLLPFSAETAAVSYQVLSQRQGQVQVLAVAMPREVLEEYESAVREAGYEPGSVLPSTLAVAGALSATEPVLLLNMDETALTTAILRRGDVLLHRTLELHMLTETIAGEVTESGEVGVAVVHTVSVEVELQQALTVAAAYFEDLVGVMPREVYLAGSVSLETVNPVAAELGLEVHDVLASADLLATTAGPGVARSMLAALRGATAL